MDTGLLISHMTCNLLGIHRSLCDELLTVVPRVTIKLNNHAIGHIDET